MMVVTVRGSMFVDLWLQKEAFKRRAKRRRRSRKCKNDDDAAAAANANATTDDDDDDDDTIVSSASTYCLYKDVTMFHAKMQNMHTPHICKNLLNMPPFQGLMHTSKQNFWSIIAMFAILYGHLYGIFK